MYPLNKIDGDDLNNSLYGGNDRDLISGKGGDDFLSGADGNDTLDGGAGKDSLDGGNGNDTLDGGAGNDFLDGGRGANTFLWGRGAGQDTILYRPDADLNRLQLGEGVAPSELRLSRQYDHLVISIANTDDTMTVHGFFMQQSASMGDIKFGSPLSEIRFADGTRWDMFGLQAQFRLADKPLLVLGDQDDHMGGPALDGGGGNDELFTGGAGLLIGGSGNDTLHGGWQADVLLGGSGDDVLFGADGDDFLDGGAGNDVLDGQGGFDAYRFGYGSGQDTIAALPQGQAGAITIDMGAGVQAGTLAVLRTSPDSPDLVLQLPLSGERMTVKDYFIAPRNVSIHFADGSVMSKAIIDMKAQGALPVNTFTGTEGGDFLSGSDGNDILLGGAGNDRLDGLGGDNLLAGGDGNDELYALNGNNVVDGGAGDDRIYVGDAGATLLFGRASGRDELHAPYGGGVTTVLLEAGIGAADIVFTGGQDGWGQGLLIGVRGAEASMRIATYFPPPEAGMPAPQLALQFADGTLWDNTLINRLLLTGDEERNTINGTMGDDRIDGRGGDDMLHGMQGNDLLLGGAGMDILVGGEGNDTLNGGQGDDFLDDSFGNNTYVFARGDGRDMIFNNIKLPETRYQTIAFTDGISPDQVHLQRVPRGTWDDLVLTIDGAPGQEITVQGYIYNDPLYATNMLLKEIRFADGSKWDRTAISALLNQGSDLGDTISGTEGDDVIDGRGGDDSLFGKGGNDTLIGGPGIDQLNGGAGADTYVFNLGDGRDQLIDVRDPGAAANTLRFGAGIGAKDLRVMQIGTDLQIAYGNAGDAIILGNNEANLPLAQQTVERIEFADGSVRSLAEFRNHAPVLVQAVPDQSVAPGQQFKLTLPAGMFSDPDAGDVVRLMLSQTSGAPLPSWLSFDAASNTLQGVAPLGAPVTVQLRVTGKDIAGLIATDDFSLAVGGSNSAPYVKAPAKPLAVAENMRFGMLTPTFADADAGDALTVKVSMAGGAALPSWLSFNGKDWLSGVTGFDSAGTYKLTATATDKGGLSTSSNFDLVVNNVNRAPQPAQAVATLEAARGTPFAATLPAKALVDADGDVLAYKLTQAGGAALPAWLSFDAQTRTLSGTPGAADPGTLSLVLDATDGGGLSGSTLFKLNVAPDAVLALSGTTADDVLNGQSAGDSLAGLDGNDQLNGFAGNDVLDGGLGADRMAGGTGDDRYLVDATGDQVVELAGEGRDTIVATVGYTLPANTEVLVQGGTSPLSGYGNGAENVLYGNSGNNFLNGYGGNDLLQGGAGNDSLVDTMGRNLFDGGSGVDTLSGGTGFEMFIGGTGNDIINTGTGVDIIAFNRGDGSDVVNPSMGQDNVISLGRGIGYADLSFKKVSGDLILGTGAGEQINLKAWYSGNYHSVAKLQVFIEGSSDYRVGAPQSMNSEKIQLFNFDALVAKFDQALLADPALGSWSLAPELAAALLRSGGNTAFGGDLAQQYATSGTLANVAQVPALAIIGSNAFGDINQYLANSALTLADGTAFLM